MLQSVDVCCKHNKNCCNQCKTCCCAHGLNKICSHFCADSLCSKVSNESHQMHDSHMSAEELVGFIKLENALVWTVIMSWYSALSLQKGALSLNLLPFCDELNKHAEEGSFVKLFREEGRSGGIGSTRRHRGTAILRKTKLVHVTQSGFPLQCAPEHDVLSTRPRLCNASHKKKCDYLHLFFFFPPQISPLIHIFYQKNTRPLFFLLYFIFLPLVRLSKNHLQISPHSYRAPNKYKTSLIYWCLNIFTF